MTTAEYVRQLSFGDAQEWLDSEGLVLTAYPVSGGAAFVAEITGAVIVRSAPHASALAAQTEAIARAMDLCDQVAHRSPSVRALVTDIATRRRKHIQEMRRG